MQYINSAREPKLIGVRRVKRWIKPGEIVDLDPFDIRTLGINGAFVIEVTPAIRKKIARHKARVEAKAKAKAAAKSKAPATKKKSAPKKAAPVKKAVKKAPVKKKVAAPTKAELAAQRKELKSAFSEMNKGAIIEFAEANLGIDVKWKDKKDTIITRALNAAKVIGYEKILKKV